MLQVHKLTIFFLESDTLLGVIFVKCIGMYWLVNKSSNTWLPAWCNCFPFRLLVSIHLRDSISPSFNTALMTGSAPFLLSGFREVFQCSINLCSCTIPVCCLIFWCLQKVGRIFVPQKINKLKLQTKILALRVLSQWYNFYPKAVFNGSLNWNILYCG